MKKKNSKDIFEQIAKEYSETKGQELRDELNSLPPSPSTRLNKLTTRKIHDLKMRKFIPVFTAIAACFLIVLVLPVVYQRQNSGAQNITEDSSEIAQTPDTQETLIPLSFTPPDNFNITDTEVDNGVSIYYLADSRQDDVVMQLEYTTTADAPLAFLKPITINGYEAYGLSTADFKMLTFIHDNILYTLTCQYDINTLVELSKNIF